MPIRNKLASAARKELSILNTIRDKLETSDATVMKADKGNTMVILYSHVYIQKVTHFLDENNIQPINKDPTKKFNALIKRQINHSKFLLSEYEIKSAKMISPTCPNLTGLPKLHKEGEPIRPLVNYTTAPSFKIAKIIDKLLKQHYFFEQKYSLNNSLELIEKTKTTQIKSHHLLVSFDIKNLYTNIPILETIRLIEENLHKNSKLNDKAISELIHLLKIILQQNYFTFDSKFYEQPEGLAMGSPLSGILSEIYLNNIENKLIFSSKNKALDKILFYYRYVDDIIVLFDGNKRQIQNLKNYLNSLAPKLEFTVEIETDKKLNFLDLTIKKEDNKLQYSIFRKPTTTSQTIHATSYHPHAHKLAAYNSMVHRLLNVPLSPEDYSNEIDTIKYIAISNGFKPSLIDHLIRKQKNKKLAPTNLNIVTEKVKFVPIEYGHRYHHILKKELHKHNIKLAPRTSNKLGRLIRKKKTSDTATLLDKTGVYSLHCSDCDKFYVGQTGRSFKIRAKEHRPDPKTKIQKSSFAQHLTDANHSTPNICDNMNVLHIRNKGSLLDTLEEYSIYTATKTQPENILNDQLNYSSHILFNTIIKAQGKSKREENMGITSRGQSTTLCQTQHSSVSSAPAGPNVRVMS